MRKPFACDPWVSAAQRLAVADSVHRASVRSESEYVDGSSRVAYIRDIVKAYECLHHDILQYEATKYFFPPVLLRFKIPSYRWSRVLLYGVEASRLTVPTRSIVAGSVGASRKIKAYTLSTLRGFHGRHIETPLNAHIDDCVWECQGKLQSEVLRNRSVASFDVAPCFKELLSFDVVFDKLE